MQTSCLSALKFRLSSLGRKGGRTDAPFLKALLNFPSLYLSLSSPGRGDSGKGTCVRVRETLLSPEEWAAANGLSCTTAIASTLLLSFAALLNRPPSLDEPDFSGYRMGKRRG